METVQLRRYVLEPGRMADFLAWFPSLLPIRELVVPQWPGQEARVVRCPLDVVDVGQRTHALQ